MPDIAAIKLETRGATTEIDEYMVTEAKRILNACAAMYDVKVKITMAGAAPACFADKELGHEVAELIEEKCHYERLLNMWTWAAARTAVTSWSAYSSTAAVLCI